MKKSDFDREKYLLDVVKGIQEYLDRKGVAMLPIIVFKDKAGLVGRLLVKLLNIFGAKLDIEFYFKENA